MCFTKRLKQLPDESDTMACSLKRCSWRLLATSWLDFLKGGMSSIVGEGVRLLIPGFISGGEGIFPQLSLDLRSEPVKRFYKIQ